MGAIVASMAHIAIHHVQHIVNQVHVMMSLVTVSRDVAMDSMVHSVKTPAHQTVIHWIVTRIQAIVIVDVFLVSLVISAVTHVLLTVLAAVNKPAVLVPSAKKVSLVGNVTRFAMQIVRVVVINLQEPVTMAAGQASTGTSVRNLVLQTVIHLNVFKEQDIVLMNASLDSMVTIATSRVQQTVILMNVNRSQVIVVEAVLLASMVANAYKYAQRIVKIYVTMNMVLVVLVKSGIMETNVQISAMKIAKLVVIM